MTKRKIKEHLMKMVYEIDKGCHDVTIFSDIEDILSTLELNIIYLKYDKDCLIKEKQKLWKRLKDK